MALDKQMVQDLDVAAVKKALEQKCEPKALTEALGAATARFGGLHKEEDIAALLEICEMLVKAGAEIVEYKCTECPETKDSKKLRFCQNESAADHTGASLFHYSCYYGNTKIIKQLLSVLDFCNLSVILRKGAQGFVEERTMKPLTLAVIKQHIICIKLLVDHCYKYGISCHLSEEITEAVNMNNPSILTLLLQLQQQKVSKVKFLGSSLKLAMEKEFYDCATILIDKKVDIFEAVFATTDEKKWEFLITNSLDGRSSKSSLDLLLFAAVQSSSLPFMQYILQDKYRGCLNVDLTVLYVAVDICDLAILRELLNSKFWSADRETKGKRWFSYAELAECFAKFLRSFDKTKKARMNDKFEICELFLTAIKQSHTNKCDVDFIHNSGDLLHYCCYYGKLELMKQVAPLFDRFLVSQLATRHEIRGKCLQPMSFAILNGHFDCFAWLLLKCVSDRGYFRPFIWEQVNLTVDCGRIDILNLLLHSTLGFENESKHFENLQKLPLTRAVDKGHEDAVDLLLNHGADIVQIFLSKKYEEKRAVILEKAVKYKNPSLKSLIFKVVKYGDAECLSYLLQSTHVGHFDIDFVVETESPLTVAAERNNLGMVVELLKHDVDSNRVIYSGESPLVFAIRNYCYPRRSDDAIAIAKSLVSYGCELNSWTDSFEHWPKLTMLKSSKVACLAKLLHIAGAVSTTLQKVLCPTFEIVPVEMFFPKFGNLKDLSRTAVRFSLGSNIPGKLASLKGQLPEHLIEYLQLPELEDANRDFIIEHPDSESDSDMEEDDQEEFMHLYADDEGVEDYAAYVGNDDDDDDDSSPEGERSANEENASGQDLDDDYWNDDDEDSDEDEEEDSDEDEEEDSDEDKEEDSEEDDDDVHEDDDDKDNDVDEQLKILNVGNIVDDDEWVTEDSDDDDE